MPLLSAILDVSGQLLLVAVYVFSGVKTTDELVASAAASGPGTISSDALSAATSATAGEGLVAFARSRLRL